MFYLLKIILRDKLCFPNSEIFWDLSEEFLFPMSLQFIVLRSPTALYSEIYTENTKKHLIPNTFKILYLVPNKL